MTTLKNIRTALILTLALTANFLPGQPLARSFDDLPASAFRNSLQAIGPEARNRAMRQFNELRIPMADVASLRADFGGSLYYACFTQPGSDHACSAGCSHGTGGGHEPETQAQPVFQEDAVQFAVPMSSAGPVPISNPPVYNSKPGASRVIYLDFNGAVISGKEWNRTYNGGLDLLAYAWSSDSDYTTFSDSEQTAIRQIWQRIAEDYAPFDVNVSTDPVYDPDNTGGSNSIGWVLFTRDVDLNGVNMPAKGAGGVAYINVFGSSSYASRYQPAFVYANNLGPNVERFMAEAGSHEMGHNMGMSHDGTKSGAEYYSGHGSGETSWAPIMGNSYNKHVTTWSKGEYFDANRTEDDLAIIAGKLGYRADDHGNTPATATPLVIDGSTIRSPLTRAFVGDDANEGIIERNTDVDFFSFHTRGGPVTVTVATFVAENASNARGGNLDVKLTLYDAAQNVVAVADSALTVAATISTSLASGSYYLAVEGTGFGSPLNNPPTGYTQYGSLGMYFISGTMPPLPELLSPTAGQTWEPGRTYTIEWMGTISGDLVRLSLLKGGLLHSTLATSLAGSTSSLEWTVPAHLQPGDDYTIELAIENSGGFTATSGAFSVKTEYPRIVSQHPDAAVELPSGQGQLSLLFSEPMDPFSFSITEHILAFTGPHGIDLWNTLTGFSWNAAATELTLNFTPQQADGYYRMVLSPYLLDMDGYPLDQNQNGLPGETPGDGYIALFRIANPVSPGTQLLFARDMSADPGFVLDAGWEWGVPSQGAVGGPNAGHTGSTVLAYNLSGRYEPDINPPRHARLPAIDTTGASGIQLQFRRWLGIAFNATGAPASRHADSASIQFSTDGSTWTQLWESGGAVLDSNWALQTYNLPAAADNQPALYIRFSLQSDGKTESFGWNIDDVIISGTTAGGSTLPPPPVVTGHLPQALVEAPQDNICLSFCQPMDSLSFAMEDILGFSGPAGPVTPTGFKWISSTLLQIDFPEQSAPGDYVLTVAPAVADLFGQLLDQNKNEIGGEPGLDDYTATFSIAAGVPELTPEEEWRLFYFETTSNAGEAADDADFDKDGIVNLLERAFGTDPTDASDAYQVQNNIMQDAASQIYLTLAYRQIAGGTGSIGVDYVAAGIRYRVEYAAALTGPWDSGSIEIVALGEPDDAGMQDVTVRLSTPLNSGIPQFVRLRVEPVN